MIENVKDFLDQPGEYYFDRNTLQLYIKPNMTEDLHDLTLGVLTELIDLRNAENVQIKDLSFRDQASLRAFFQPQVVLEVGVLFSTNPAPQ